MLRKLPSVAAVLAAVLLGACNSLGPAAVGGGRTAYNQVLADSQSEQLLLNLVRLRYVDVPLFLEVTSVNTQYEFRGALDASITGNLDDPLSTYGDRLGAGVSATEKPTVTYVPLQGDDFVRRLMTPIDIDTVALLSRSGWSSSRVLRVCAQSLSGLPNAPTAAGPTPVRPPQFREFQRATALLRSLQQESAAEFVRDAAGAYRLLVRDEGQDAAELCALLRVPSARDLIVTAGNAPVPGRLTVETRSVLGAMFYLAQGVEVPEGDALDGRVTVTRDFDWAELTGDVLRIRSASRRPDDAAVAVRYRGHWFYVDDADLSSKATFALLSYLFAIQSGGRSALQPALTIPL